MPELLLLILLTLLRQAMGEFPCLKGSYIIDNCSQYYTGFKGGAYHEYSHSFDEYSDNHATRGNHAQSDNYATRGNQALVDNYATRGNQALIDNHATRDNHALSDNYGPSGTPEHFDYRDYLVTESSPKTEVKKESALIVGGEEKQEKQGVSEKTEGKVGEKKNTDTKRNEGKKGERIVTKDENLKPQKLTAAEKKQMDIGKEGMVGAEKKEKKEAGNGMGEEKGVKGKKEKAGIDHVKELEKSARVKINKETKDEKSPQESAGEREERGKARDEVGSKIKKVPVLKNGERIKDKDDAGIAKIKRKLEENKEKGIHAKEEAKTETVKESAIEKDNKVMAKQNSRIDKSRDSDIDAVSRDKLQGPVIAKDIPKETKADKKPGIGEDVPTKSVVVKDDSEKGKDEARMGQVQDSVIREGSEVKAKEKIRAGKSKDSEIGKDGKVIDEVKSKTDELKKSVVEKDVGDKKKENKNDNKPGTGKEESGRDQVQASLMEKINEVTEKTGTEKSKEPGKINDNRIQTKIEINIPTESIIAKNDGLKTEEVVSGRPKGKGIGKDKVKKEEKMKASRMKEKSRTLLNESVIRNEAEAKTEGKNRIENALKGGKQDKVIGSKAEISDKAKVQGLENVSGRREKVSIEEGGSGKSVEARKLTGEIPRGKEMAEVVKTIKIGVSPVESSNSIKNSSAVGISPVESSNSIKNSSAVGVSSVESSSSITNSPAVGVPSVESSNSITNSSAVGISSVESSNSITNSSAVGVSSVESSNSITNSPAVGISSVESSNSIKNRSMAEVSPVESSSTIPSSSAVGVSPVASSSTISSSSTLAVSPVESSSTITSRSALAVSPVASSTTIPSSSAAEARPAPRPGLDTTKLFSTFGAWDSLSDTEKLLQSGFSDKNSKKKHNVVAVNSDEPWNNIDFSSPWNNSDFSSLLNTDLSALTKDLEKQMKEFK